MPAAPICATPRTASEPRSDADSACHLRPHRLYVEMAAHPGAVPYARRCARQALAAWQLGIEADVELVTSELVTNAITATLGMQAAAPVVVLYLALEHDQLFVLVWDCCPDLPVLGAHADDAESGRGLQLVQALSADWGAFAEPGGKVVFAMFDLERQSHE